MKKVFNAIIHRFNGWSFMMSSAQHKHSTVGIKFIQTFRLPDNIDQAFFDEQRYKPKIQNRFKSAT